MQEKSADKEKKKLYRHREETMMNKETALSVALDSIRGSIHRAKRPVVGILADKKITLTPAQPIKDLIEVLETAERQLEVLSLSYAVGVADTPGECQ